MQALWRIELLGGLRVRQGERLITRFRSQRTALLLAYLAYYRHRSQPREVLTELLWPDAEPEAARHSLSQALSSLRHQLEPPGVAAGAVIVADRTTVELNPKACATDVAEFEEALRRANQARHGLDYAARLAEAVELYSGPLLTGYYEDWVLTEQERLRERFSDAVLELTHVLEQAGELGPALEYARRAVREDPLRERAHQALLRLLLAGRQPEAALRHYRELERLLKDELATTPAAVTRHLLRQAEGQWLGLSRTPDAPAPAAGGPAAPAPAPLRSAVSSPALETLPTGTVTFLLTDIEGSTALWERLGEGFKPHRAAHHAALREVFRRHGGHEVQEAGDSFLVAFAAASDALDCAVAGQRALAAVLAPAAGFQVDAAADPETGPPFRVRMALQSGDVELVEGEYRGLALHRASRVLSAGHGGQILCSEATAALLRHDVGGATRLRDLGLYRLRGVEVPARLFQVEYREMLQSEWPPLRAEPVQRGSVPLQFTRFFGRETELAQLQELLTPLEAPAGPQSTAPSPLPQRSRLVTLLGLGGTGKSRLAIEAAAQVREAYRGAVWFVPLADLVDPGLIPGALLDALGLARSGTAEALDQVVHALGGQPSLLVLDNLEQLLEGGAELVQTLLERLPLLRCLVTSRQVLGLPGERAFPVPPLPTPNGPDTPEQLSLFDSVRLFIDRAQAVKPDFQVTTGNAAAVAELCDRLEGLPLAIELAAARAVVLTPSQMLAQFGDRFGLLATRRRGVPERHRTLRAALDWSYRLLAPELQRFLTRLSVFRGGWSVEAAEQVTGEPLALDSLAQLRECWLVLTEESAPGMRFRMLEMVREYAAERLGTEATLTGRRHAEYFLQLAEAAAPELEGPAQGEWLDRLEMEQDNLRAVLQWYRNNPEGDRGLRLCRALSRFWQVRGHWTEGREWGAAALADPAGQERTVARAAVLLETAGLAQSQGDNATARALLEEALVLHRELGERQGEARSLLVLGIVHMNSGDYAAAQALYEQALLLNRELGSRRGEAATLINLGHVASLQGNTSAARALFQEALVQARELGNQTWEAIALDSLGSLAQEQGDYAVARALLGDALILNRNLGNRSGVAGSLSNLGIVAQKQGDYVAAQTLCQEALLLNRELGNPLWEAANLHNLGSLAACQGEHAAARALLEDALVLHRNLGSRSGEAHTLNDLGRVAQEQRDDATARALLEQALVLHRELGGRQGEARSLLALGIVHQNSGDYAAAQALYEQALLLNGELGSRSECAECLVAVALLAARDDPERAARLTGSAAALRDQCGAVPAPADQKQEARAAAAVRGALGEAAFATLFDAGKALSFDEAVALALEYTRREGN